MWKFATVAMVAAAFAAESVGQEGGFQAPVNGEPLVSTEQAGEPGFYTKVEFVMGSSRRVERRVPVSHLTAGRLASIIAWRTFSVHAGRTRRRGCSRRAAERDGEPA